MIIVIIMIIITITIIIIIYYFYYYYYKCSIENSYNTVNHNDTLIYMRYMEGICYKMKSNVTE